MPVSDNIYASLKKGILQGVYRRGTRMPTRQSLMKKHRASRGSVDKAIRQLVNEKLLESLQGSGTFVSQEQKTMTGNEKEEGFNLYVILNTEVRCMESGGFDQRWGPLLEGNKTFEGTHIIPSLSLEERIEELCSSFNNRIIWSRPPLSSMTYIDRLNYTVIPQMVINRNFPSCNYISTDTKGGIRQAIEAIQKERSINEIALFCPPINPELPFQAEREIAFHEVCVESELKRSRTFRAEDPSSRFFMKAAKEALAAGVEVIYANDYESVPYLISASEQLGRRLGEDLFLITMDWRDNHRNTPGIYCLSQDWEGMFRKAISWAAQAKPYFFQDLSMPSLQSPTSHHPIAHNNSSLK
ncbi:MAG: GntR family transcriptional regulator [Planctomycetes bacterium]|nr:GntR family transcriptional regulator [Planctomycetota bacterium]